MSNEVVLGPLVNFSGADELSAWSAYASKHIAKYDMLQLEAELKGFEKAEMDSKGNIIIECLKERWKKGLSFTSIGPQILVSVNLLDTQIRKQTAKKLKIVKEDELDKDGRFVFLDEQQKSLLISDPRGNIAVQDVNQAHIFTFTTRAYWHMLREKEDQVIVIKYCAICSLLTFI